MQDDLKKFIELIHQAEKERVINLSDPEDLYKFDLKWKLMHKRYAILHDRQLILEKDKVE
jgi:hypothetical protein